MRRDSVLQDKIAEISEEITQRGIRLESGTDFERFVHYAESAGRPVSPFFDPKADPDCERRFWIVGRDADGEVVHLQATRCDWVTPSLARFMVETIPELYGRVGDKLVPIDHSPCRASIVHQLKGPVCYQGDAWVAPRSGGVRGEVAGQLMWLGQLIAFYSYDPNAIYGLVSRRTALAGFPQRSGYNHCAPGAIIWKSMPDGVTGCEWIAWNDRKDISARLSTEQAAPDLDHTEDVALQTAQPASRPASRTESEIVHSVAI